MVNKVRVDESMYDERMDWEQERKEQRVKYTAIGKQIRGAVFGGNPLYRNSDTAVFFSWGKVLIFLMILDLVAIIGVLFIMPFLSFMLLISLIMIGGFTYIVYAFEGDIDVLATFKVKGDMITVVTTDRAFARKLEKSDVAERLKNFKIKVEVR